MKLGGDHLALHHVFRFKHTELNEMYAVMAFRSFIVSLVGIFVPIYLWTLGYPLVDIFIIHLLIYLGDGILEIPVTFLLARFGPKRLIALSMPLLVAHFLILWTIPNFHWAIPIIAFSASIPLALFWQPYYYDFSKAKHSHEACKEVSLVLVLTSLTAALAPFIGGFIASHFGIGYVFALVAFLLVFAVAPLFKKGEQHVVRKIDYGRLKINKIREDLVSYWGMGTQGVVGMVVWPIFVYFIVKTYQNVGLATSMAMILTLVFTYLLGKSADHGKRQRYLKTGSFMMGLVYFVKAIASTFIHVFSLDFLSNLANAFFYAPFISEYYLHADEESRNEYLTIMEITSDLSRAFLLLFLAFLTLFFSDQTVLIIGLVLAGFGSLFISLMPPAKSEIEIKNKTIKVQRMIGAKNAAR